MRRVNQSELIAEITKYCEAQTERGRQLLDADSEAERIAFAKAAQETEDKAGAMLAALINTLTPKGLNAVRRRVGELTRYLS